MLHYVYRTTHIPTGRWYVGIRTSRRWPTQDPYLGSGKALRSVVRAHPRSEFSKQVLVIVETREEAARIEAALVGAAEVANPMCLNLCEGGQAGPVGYRHDDETLKLIGAASKLRVYSEETREKRRQIHLGRRLTENHKRKLSEAARGRKPSPQTVEAVRRAWTGRKHSEASKQKMRTARRAD